MLGSPYSYPEELSTGSARGPPNPQARADFHTEHAPSYKHTTKEDLARGVAQVIGHQAQDGLRKLSLKIIVKWKSLGTPCAKQETIYRVSQCQE